MIGSTFRRINASLGVSVRLLLTTKDNVRPAGSQTAKIDTLSAKRIDRPRVGRRDHGGGDR